MKESVLFNSVKYTQQLQEWYATPAGQILYKELLTKLDKLLPSLFGYHALQIGGLANEIDLISSSKIGQKIYMTFNTKKGNVAANPLALPFPQNTLDLIVLPHTLDISPKPHQVLREIHRVLISEGHLVMIGFNPFSMMGLSKLLFIRSQRAPWAAHFYTQRRLKDWLSLLGFKVIIVEHLGLQPPIQNMHFQQRMQFLSKAEKVGLGRLGALQILVAKKRELTLTPTPQPWRPRRRMIPVNVTEPTARQSKYTRNKHVRKPG
ncbi:MAG: methyltransferase domain-containing protein [Gammaproteobacteria bacterium]|nr:methyltransferase domain-containing protein [Gammaproteobacteria bacterium]